MKVQAVDKFVDKLKKIQEEAEAALCKAHDDMKHFADGTHWSTKKGIRCSFTPKTYVSINHQHN